MAQLAVLDRPGELQPPNLSTGASNFNQAPGWTGRCEASPASFLLSQPLARSSTQASTQYWLARLDSSRQVGRRAVGVHTYATTRDQSEGPSHCQRHALINAHTAVWRPKRDKSVCGAITEALYPHHRAPLRAPAPPRVAPHTVAVAMPDEDDPRDALSCFDCVNAIFYCMCEWPNCVAVQGNSGRHCLVARTRLTPRTHARTAPRAPCPSPAPRNQSRSYYREGKFDRCEQQFADLSFCTKLKTVSKAKALEMLKELAKEQPSPTLGSIWRERGTDEPGF